MKALDSRVAVIPRVDDININDDVGRLFRMSLVLRLVSVLCRISRTVSVNNTRLDLWSKRRMDVIDTALNF